MERFTSEDVQRGWKICTKCKTNVFPLKDVQDVKRFIPCKTCGTNDVIPVKDYFNTGIK